MVRTRRVLLSAIGGYLDGVAFLMLGGFFINQVTGDVIVGAVALARGGTGRSWVELAMLPVFLVAVTLSTALVTRPGSTSTARDDARTASTLLMLEALLLVVFTALGLVFYRRPHAGSALVTAIVGGSGVCAAACQGTLGRIERYPESTTVMTTNAIQLGIDTGQLLVGGAQPRHSRAIRRRAAELGEVLVSFFAGAAVGAALADHIHFWSVFVPVGLIGLLALQARREYSPT